MSPRAFTSQAILGKKSEVDTYLTSDIARNVTVIVDKETKGFRKTIKVHCHIPLILVVSYKNQWESYEFLYEPADEETIHDSMKAVADKIAYYQKLYAIKQLACLMTEEGFYVN